MKKLFCDKCGEAIEGEHYVIEEVEFFKPHNTTAELIISRWQDGNTAPIVERERADSWVSYLGFHLHPGCLDITVAELIKRILR